MPQDTFTLRLLASELDGALRGGKINKINQPQKEELSLSIYTGKGTLKLILNANAGDCGVYFTEDTPENPPVPQGFCMLLRKHLTGAEIQSVALDGFERILVFSLYCRSDFSCCTRQLRCEIMGKYSNLILTEKGIILGALKTASLDANFRRAVFPGAPYVLPAPQDKVNPSDEAAMKNLFSSPIEGSLSDFLFRRVAGLAPFTAEQIAKSYRGGDLASFVRSYIFSDEISPCVLERDGEPCEFYPRQVGGAKPFKTLSDAQMYFYRKKRLKKKLEGTRRRILSAVSSEKKKQEKRLFEIGETLREAASFEENRKMGELLTANLYAIGRGQKSCEVADFYGEAGAVKKIPLDETLSPAQNAQRYFKKYRKQKRAREFLLPKEEEARAALDYLDSVRFEAEAAESEEDLSSVEEELILCGMYKPLQTVRGKKQGEGCGFRRFEKDGFLILAGRNNLQNDKLLKESEPEDLWLHTQKYHSSHVVIKSGGRTVPNEVLLYAAQICVRYSDAKGGGKTPVDYCSVRRVKKPRGAKAGFVVYSDYQTLLAEPLEQDAEEKR